MNTFRGSRNHSRPPTPINVTVNVQVNGFRLTDIALQAEIERHRKSEENSGHSQEEVIVRGLCDVAENSEDSQKVTNFWTEADLSTGKAQRKRSSFPSSRPGFESWRYWQQHRLILSKALQAVFNPESSRWSFKDDNYPSWYLTFTLSCLSFSIAPTCRERLTTEFLFHFGFAKLMFKPTDLKIILVHLWRCHLINCHSEKCL